MTVGLIIPAYNAGEHIQIVIENASKYIHRKHIFVVDDGSTDRTEEIAISGGVHVIQHESNRGKGEALKSGFQAIDEKELDAVITLDSDGQHPPDRIPDFIAVMEKTGCDIVLGKRSFRVGEMPLDRIFSNWMSSRLASWTAGSRILDSQNGYRLIRTKVFRRMELKTSRFETETELLIKAAWEGFTIDYCPIPNSYRGEGSHIHRGQDTLRFFKLILNLLREKRKHDKHP